MVRTSTAQVEAREKARARLAERHAAARAREQATQDDLVAFIALDADTATAATTRDAAIAAATSAYNTSVAATRTAQAAKVGAMLTRGESATDVAELTGWTAKAVRATATPASPATTDKPTDKATGPAEPAA